jgi:WD40 repeat protein
MRPLALKGHTRPITRVRLNQEGDILFSSAKDKHICVWYTENGERIGTYEGFFLLVTNYENNLKSNKNINTFNKNKFIF